MVNSILFTLSLSMLKLRFVCSLLATTKQIIHNALIDIPLLFAERLQQKLKDYKLSKVKTKENKNFQIFSNGSKRACSLTTRPNQYSFFNDNTEIK